MKKNKAAQELCAKGGEPRKIFTDYVCPDCFDPLFEASDGGHPTESAKENVKRFRAKYSPIDSEMEAMMWDSYCRFCNADGELYQFSFSVKR